jgi:(p)ppGpp synthase/HD superfamily hydrolase
MHGAKVNGKLVSFDTKLRNGDVVEIMERPSAKPTTKWLDFAKTGMARRHIRTMLEPSETRPTIAHKPKQEEKPRPPRNKKHAKTPKEKK